MFSMVKWFAVLKTHISSQAGKQNVEVMLCIITLCPDGIFFPHVLKRPTYKITHP